MSKVKEYMSEALKQDRMVNLKIEQLERLRAMAEKCTSVVSDMPGSPTRNNSAREMLLVKMIDLEHEINQEIDRLVDMKRERSALIDKIGKPEYQDVLVLRYLLAMTWENVAERLDRSVSYTYKLHGWALKELEEIISENQK